ncbi:uncharacterized protein LOC128548675 [Mercenaria mercenaria]|uniref:uncharacterized protein LOC128548675 n=1 Tax=Mercenaria mercenaria TaxID=6596 RepID=UPI00234F9187|nr:uncharacterized protein LOC128548675 [Mercenaria mercenaria]XP_053380008.1 uncharacterized protein LOC128548675 [Mercenaria mercenaria]
MVYVYTTVFLLVTSQFWLAKSFDPPLNMNEFNHELDAEFAAMDTDKDNVVSEREMETYVLQQDYNNDGCITFVEFMKNRIHDTLMFSWALFNHFDHNDDDCLASWDEIQEFDEIDLNPKDSVFTLAEFEAYYDKLYKKMGLAMKP